MAGSFSDYLENAVLDAIHNAAAFSSPATLYFALFTTAPTDAGGGVEVTGGSYARKAVTANTTNFPSASGGAITNGTAITFVTASASWGTVVAVGVFDAASAGNLLEWVTLAVSKAVGIGDTFQLNAGDYDYTLD